MYLNIIICYYKNAAHTFNLTMIYVKNIVDVQILNVCDAFSNSLNLSF